MKKLIYLLPLLFLSSCIQDDIIFDTVEETLRITNPIDTLAVGDSIQLEIRYTNNIGEEEQPVIDWVSSAPSIINIDPSGLAIGQMEGNADLVALVSINNSKSIADTIQVIVKEDVETVFSEDESRMGMIRTTSSYTLTGDFSITQEMGDLQISFAENYEASRSLPGLYLYLTNNPNSVANALEIGKVDTFSGAHTYVISGIDINDYDYLFYYCKPFQVKVGDGEIQ